MPLDPGVVQLWYVPVHAPDSVRARLEGHLSPEEQERVRRFTRPADRQRQLLARGLVREVLAPVLGLPPERIAFKLGAHGKPAVAGDRAGVHFNLSHSGDWVALALARDSEVGIDIEAPAGHHRMDAIAARLYGPTERTWLAAASAERRLDTFYRLWTVREAYLKAVGIGLAGASGQDCLTPDGQLVDPAWQVWRLTHPTTCHGALVTRQGERRVIAWSL